MYWKKGDLLEEEVIKRKEKIFNFIKNSKNKIY